MKKLTLEQYNLKTLYGLIEINIDEYTLSEDLIEFFEKHPEEYLRNSNSAKQKKEKENE